jgi:transposase
MLRALKAGLNPIFIDECGFNLFNDNFHSWIKKDSTYHAKLPNQNNKINLIMAVSFNKIFFYTLNDLNTNKELFLQFMKNLLNNMAEKEKNESIFILDNLKCHCTFELFEFYYNNNLRILFNVPYYSDFNMIERCFRFIKNVTYKKIYTSKNNLLNDIKNILEGEEIRRSLKKLFKETLNIYKSFLNNNELINLND